METDQKFLDQISLVVEKANYLEIKLEMILCTVLRPATSDYGHVLEKALHNTVISLGGKLQLIRAILDYWQWNDLQKQMGKLDDVIRIRNAFAHTSTARRQMVVEFNPKNGCQTEMRNQMIVESRNGRRLERIERDKAFQRFNNAYESSITLISEIGDRIKTTITQQVAVAEENNCGRSQKIINRIWPKMQTGRQYRTPDLYKGKEFRIEEKSNQKIKIKPQNISIAKEAFLATLQYLIQNKHNFNNQCIIRSSNSRKDAGPLCIASRDQNSNVRCINYILPILQYFQIVGIDPVRPNKTWLL